MHRSAIVTLVLAAAISACVQNPLPSVLAAQVVAQSAPEPRPALPDTPGTGPYAALKETDARLAAHVVYRPADLGSMGELSLGVMLWGNGGCSDDGASARFHLLEIASHGYVAIAPGDILSGPGAPPPTPREPGLVVRTTSADVLSALDWVLAENMRPGSPYFARINPDAVAVAGHSCGGLQALELATDPRIKTAIIHNSGVFNDGGNPIRGITVNKELLARVDVPVLYVLGGESDIAYANGVDDFGRLTHTPAALITADVGHGGTFGEANGGDAAEISAAWLQWRLRGDAEAASQFVGVDCGLCDNADWHLERNAALLREGGQ